MFQQAYYIGREMKLFSAVLLQFSKIKLLSA